METIKLVDFDAEVKKYKSLYNKAFNKALSSGFFILGAEVKNFENNLADYLGVKYAIGVGNGLEALQISLMALGIGQADEVITTPISAVATTLAIIAVGAKPVFIDTDENGLINPDLIPNAITKNTKAILPVHLYGNSVDLKKIKKICKEYKLYLIEDACQAHGSLYQNKRLGTFGDIGCFSFYPTKNLGAFGDGGAIVTNDSKLAKKCFQIRDYGQEGKYIHKLYGLNSRLDELHAAILDTKLSFLDSQNKHRRKIAEFYIKNLPTDVIVITPNSQTIPNYHIFAIRTKKRNQLKEFLSKYKIQTAIHYPKIIPEQPFYSLKLNKDQLKESRGFVNETLSLPCNPYTTITQAEFVASKINQFFK